MNPPTRHPRPAIDEPHPSWCERGHHCTADRLPEGEHASRPEVWRTRIGRVVATRHRSRHGRDRLELRLIVTVTGTEPAIQVQARHLIAAAYAALEHTLDTDRPRRHDRRSTP